MEPVLERAIALHLAECAACRDIVRDSERIAAAFALGAPMRRARPGLRKRVFLAAGISRPGPLRKAFTYGRAVAGLAAVFVAVAAFTGMVWLRGQLGDVRQTNSDLQTQINDALSQKVQIAALTQKIDDQQEAADRLQASAQGDQDLIVALLSTKTKIADVISKDEFAHSVGRLIWDADQKRVWFVASDLPQRTGASYQVWVSSGGKYYSLGTFQPDENGFARHQAILPEGITSYDSAVVTIERAGGSPVREGPTVFFVADLSGLKN
jgi:hypothetical protein